VVTHPPSLPTVDAGVYDPSHAFDRIHTLAYEAVWVSWDRYKNGQLSPQLKKITSKGRQSIITAPQTQWNFTDTKDGLIHFTGKQADNYAAVMSDNFTALTVWSKADPEAQTTK
jgi:hypothetical protein